VSPSWESRLEAARKARTDGAGESGPAASRDLPLPENVTWHRVSLVTPVLEGWKIVTGVLAFVTVQNLDELVLANRTLGDEVLHGHRAALGEQLGDAADVHGLELDPVGVAEAAQLGKTHVQRHLATLETRTDLVTSLGALGTATGGLTLGRLTTTHTGLGLLGAGGGTQVVQLDDAHLLLLRVLGVSHLRPPQR